MEKIQVKLVRKTSVVKILKGEGTYEQFLPTHTADEEVQLIMVKGEIMFTLDGKSFALQAGDLQIIPAKISHRLKVLAACQFYLIMATNTKMSFSKSTT